MKTTTKMFLAFSLIFIMFSCKKSDDLTPVDPENLFIGYWVNPQENNTVYSFDRAGGMKESEYGFAFKHGQKFIERENSSRCATPPVSYKDFDGIWNRNDSIIDITVEYWGGISQYQWKVLSIDNKKLTIKKIK